MGAAAEVDALLKQPIALGIALQGAVTDAEQLGSLRGWQPFEGGVVLGWRHALACICVEGMDPTAYDTPESHRAGGGEGKTPGRGLRRFRRPGAASICHCQGQSWSRSCRQPSPTGWKASLAMGFWIGRGSLTRPEWNSSMLLRPSPLLRGCPVLRAALESQDIAMCAAFCARLLSHGLRSQFTTGKSACLTSRTSLVRIRYRASQIPQAPTGAGSSDCERLREGIATTCLACNAVEVLDSARSSPGVECLPSWLAGWLADRSRQFKRHRQGPPGWLLEEHRDRVHLRSNEFPP